MDFLLILLLIVVCGGGIGLVGFAALYILLWLLGKIIGEPLANWLDAKKEKQENERFALQLEEQMKEQARYRAAVEKLRSMFLEVPLTITFLGSEKVDGRVRYKFRFRLLEEVKEFGEKIGVKLGSFCLQEHKYWRLNGIPFYEFSTEDRRVKAQNVNSTWSVFLIPPDYDEEFIIEISGSQNESLKEVTIPVAKGWNYPCQHPPKEFLVKCHYP